ncbi:hypothetical protein ASC97_12475 [Rhizobium sp. Root1203]|uniref:hypothetical protein n=1 Tax=Rhizobium sp. Root1203 TaxID=1736427 RepID=UPI000708D11E|nr:hypothetical protein [Rhizobium sp. Root1203]KQV14016.1 hypothetical protein ASC97_12475 [Rhizobium sp. Root1203]
MGDVVSLERVRARKRPAPVPSFDVLVERFFVALDLLDEVEGGALARQAVYDGVEMLLMREEGVRHGR